jgi:hypothetical protein
LPLYLFSNAQFSLAVCADGEGRRLPPGEWTLLKPVEPAEIDAAIVARVMAEGYWFYKPGQPPGAGDATSEKAAEPAPPPK